MAQETQDDFAAIATPLPKAKGKQTPAPATEADDFAAIAHPAEFTQNDNSEGTYEMEAPGKGKIKIPYSQVLEAGKSGYSITPDDFKRFTKDYGHAEAKKGGLRAQVDEALAPADEYTWAGRGLNVIKGTTAGVVNPFLHPIQALESFPALGMPTSMTTNQQAQDANNAAVKSQAESIHNQAKEAAQHPFYTAATIAGPALLGEGVGRVVPKLKAKVGAGITDKVRLGDEAVNDLVNKTTAKNEENVKTADQANAANAEKHLNDTLDSMQKTREAEDLHSHTEKTRKEELDKTNEEKRKEFNESELARVKKEGEARLKVLEANKEKMVDYKEQVAKIKAENAIDYRREVQRQNVDSKLASASKQLDQKVGAAYNKAKSQYNGTWNKWRDLVKNAKADMSTTVDTINAQEKSMNPQQVGIFREILRESGPEDVGTSPAVAGASLDDLVAKKILAGGYKQALSGELDRNIAPDVIALFHDLKDATGKKLGAEKAAHSASASLTEIPAERLHGWKSQLERAVRTTSDGTVRHAIGQVLDQLRKAEGDVSASVGPDAVKQLTKARSITGPYFDAFFKAPEEVPRQAGKVIRQESPEYAKERNARAELDRIAAYDPSITAVANNVANLRQALSSIPKGVSNVTDFKQLPTPPTGKPVPGVTPARPFEPTPFDPKPEPTRVAPPDRPATVEPEITKVGMDDIRKAKEEALQKGAKWIRYRGRWIATSAIIGSTLYQFLHGNLTSVGDEIVSGAAAMYLTGKVADYLERPEVTEWLTRPTAKDVETLRKLPPEQRKELADVWKPITKEAIARGIKVAPALAGVLGGISSRKKKPTPQEMLQQAHQNLQSGFYQSGYGGTPPNVGATYSHTAVNDENGHTIGSNDGSTWFDVQTGVQVPQ